ncbi:MAG: hypothetical protein R6V19_00415 [Armatimonadota bacterium]
MIAAALRLGLADDLPKTGFGRSVAREYNGLDWGRNIIWDKDRYVFVIDDMAANEPGDYLFTTHWRTLGETVIEDRTLAVEQNGESFRLSNTDGSRLQLRTDPAPGKLRLYEHAEAPGAILEQYSHKQLEAGDSHSIENVFYCPDEEVAQAEALHIAPGVIALAGEVQTIAGIADDGVTVGDLSITASQFLVSPERLAVADATSITWQDHDLLTTPAPVSLELNLAANTISAVISADDTVQFNPPGPAPAVTLTANSPGQTIECDWPDLAGAISSAISASEGRQPSPADTAVSRNAAVNNVAEVDDTVTAAEFADMTGDGVAEALVGTESGLVHVLGAGGEEIARVQAQAAVTALAAGDISGDAAPELIIGTETGVLTAHIPGGETLWSYVFQQPDISQAGLYVTDILCHNLDGAGKNEIIATSLSGSWSVLDASGKPIKEIVYGKSALVAEATDLDGDGTAEYTVGTEWRGMNMFRFGSNWSRRYRPGRGVKSAAFADINGDGMKEALYGSEILRALNEFPDEPGGERWDSLMWEYNTGGQVLSLRTADITADGTPDILAGSKGFYLHAVNAQGEQLWARLCGGPVSSLAVAGEGAETTIVAGTDTGRVTIFDAEGSLLAVHTFDAPVVQVHPADTGAMVITEDGRMTRLSPAGNTP